MVEVSTFTAEPRPTAQDRLGDTRLRIIHTVSSLQGGGMEQFVLRLAESQRACGHEASVVAITGGPLLDIARQKAVPTVVLHGERAAERIGHCAAHFAIYRPDIVHCHNPTALHYAAVAKIASRGRLVFTDHAQTKGIIRMGSAFEWPLVDAFAAVSGETAKHCGDIGYRGTPEVVHNGVSFAPARRDRADVRADLGIGGRVVGINVASFFPVKAQDVLVRAAAVLKRASVPVTLLFLGEGAARASVEDLAHGLGLGPTEVRFLGFRNDIPDLLAASDLFVLPSRGEGFPMSILEAMSHRLPIVCTPVGGNPELVTEGEHGRLVPVDDPGALAAAIGALVEDEDLRRKLGDAGHARVTSEFTFERTTDKYEAMYRRALAAPRRFVIV
ncbi:Glycosyltransferase [Minicystis rosea]|nr:Glycosyltransferase [Minicystis rosea]